jgi:long-chain acyl-CoA synthetase
MQTFQNSTTQFLNLGGLLRQASLTNPDGIALVCGEERLSFEGLDQSTDALARWLLRTGLEPGDRIAIHWSNSLEVVQLYFACFKAGLIAVPLNNRLKAPEIAYILRHSRAKICFSQPALVDLCEEVWGDSPDLLILTSSLPPLDFREAPRLPLPEVTPDQIAAIMYTSGTTARPKGVVHTHISLIGATEMMCSLGIPEASSLLAVSQLMHIAALVCVLLPAISRGSTVVLLPAFEAAELLDLVERWHCAYFFILPAMLQFVVEEQASNPRDVSSMQLCIAGGDAVPVTLQERFRGLFGVSIRELYGMTETVPVTCNREGLLREGSVGPALEIVETRVVDLSGGCLADGHVGELQVQSPANCVGYWDDPEATAATFDGGWLRTGDLVKRDGDRFYWFAGRVKQIIVRGGSNISPQEVEEALYRHPAVLEAGVIGLPDPIHGEKVIAFVALREGLTLQETELRDSVRGWIADYKTPERILFVPVLPKGLTGKVQRRDLKNLFLTHSESREIADSSPV